MMSNIPCTGMAMTNSAAAANLARNRSAKFRFLRRVRPCRRARGTRALASMASSRSTTWQNIDGASTCTRDARIHYDHIGQHRPERWLPDLTESLLLCASPQPPKALRRSGADGDAAQRAGAWAPGTRVDGK